MDTVSLSLTLSDVIVRTGSIEEMTLVIVVVSTFEESASQWE